MRGREAEGRIRCAVKRLLPHLFMRIGQHFWAIASRDERSFSATGHKKNSAKINVRMRQDENRREIGEDTAKHDKNG